MATTNYAWNTPTDGADDDVWGLELITLAQDIDTEMFKKANLAGATFTGAVVLPASTTSLAPLRIPHGAAPTSLTDGMIWTTTAGVFVRIDGATVGPLAAAGGAVTVNNDNWSGTDLSVANGGTGSSTAAGARSNLGAAASGANSDITSLTGLTTALSVSRGGTGGTTAAAARSALGVAIGSDVQAYDADLTSLSNGRILGNVSGGSAGPSQLTAAQVAALIEGLLDLSDMSIGTGAPASFYVKLGSLYIQWGSVSVTPAQSGTGGQGTATFAVAFPTACSICVPFLYLSGGGLGSGLNVTPYIETTTPPTTTNATIGLDQDGAGSPGAMTVGYLAVGY